MKDCYEIGWPIGVFDMEHSQWISCTINGKQKAKKHTKYLYQATANSSDKTFENLCIDPKCKSAHRYRVRNLKEIAV